MYLLTMWLAIVVGGWIVYLVGKALNGKDE